MGLWGCGAVGQGQGGCGKQRCSPGKLPTLRPLPPGATPTRGGDSSVYNLPIDVCLVEYLLQKVKFLETFEIIGGERPSA